MRKENYQAVKVKGELLDNYRLLSQRNLIPVSRMIEYMMQNGLPMWEQITKAINQSVQMTQPSLADLAKLRKKA